LPQVPFNLSVDTPPVFGETMWSIIRIEKSDGAEGIVEFGVENGEIRVHEEDEEVQVRLVRIFLVNIW